MRKRVLPLIPNLAASAPEAESVTALNPSSITAIVATFSCAVCASVMVVTKAVSVTAVGGASAGGSATSKTPGFVNGADDNSSPVVAPSASGLPLVRKFVKSPATLVPAKSAP